MCGKETELIKVIIEGTKLNVCPSCGSFGKIVSVPKKQEEPKLIKQPPKPLTQEIESLVFSYGNKIKTAREKMNFTQKEFAQKLSERESIISKIERGAMEPTITLTKKIEKLCNIKLIEKETVDYKEEKIDFKGGNLTIGDLIKLKNE